MALPGPAQSKSISATARPARKTRLAGWASLWLTRPVRNRAGMGRGQEYPAGSKEVAAQQVGHADQGRVGERVLGQRRDGGLAVDVGQGLCGGAGGQHPGSAVE